MLEKSWAKTFADKVFPAIDENIFSVLYSEKASRPNTPVNVIVGALILKEALNVTDDEIVEAMAFDIRYQYALHTTSFEEQPISDRTLSRFRARVLSYETEHDVDLIHECVVKMAKEISDFMDITPDKQRMDSLMVAANIRNLSLLELFYTCVANLCKIMDERGTKIPDEQHHYIEKDDYKLSIYDCFVDSSKTKDAVIKTKYNNLYIIPSSSDLSAAEIELAYEDKREFFLKNAIDMIKKNFDFIIIDSPPALGMITINIMTASDSVLIPIQCEYYALEGLTQLLNTIKLTQNHFNKKLSIEGLLLTMLDQRTNLGLEVSQEVRKYFKEKVYKTVIPRNIKLSEAPSAGICIFDYDGSSVGAQAYKELAKEVLSRNG